MSFPGSWSGSSPAGKWWPRLLSFVSSLNDAVVRDASGKAFASLPDVSKAMGELTILKGVGPATASAVLAAYAPDVAPFVGNGNCFYAAVFHCYLGTRKLGS
ncbi:hypothetical protein PHJA_001522900 [Phtheirospermum japonicum]|uniref:Uncharacterized protein n=1 Tax=Phtheirospermum japonicum TaxID=374723 RepID=A0A830CF03_9LAMI|nr:hypothetical protein PHJA_001522900 [Phtheirospermum japonicum]